MSTDRPLTEKQEKQQPAVWWIDIGADSGLVAHGVGLCVEETTDKKNVYVDLPTGRHLLLSAQDGQARLFVPGGGIPSVFARVRDGRVCLSNVATRLMKKGDRLGLDTFTFLQNLTGSPYPQRNIFKDIELLEASGSYLVKDGSLVYEGSLLAGSNDCSTDEVLDHVLSRLEPLCASGRPLAVLISGGYDSRLNLSMALAVAKIYGNDVRAFHEYKDEYECSIARAVADAAQVPLTIKTRESFLDHNRSVFLDDVFIDFQSGFYRENLMRWHAYLAWIQQEMPGCLILGLGAEAHKGKYYKQVLSIHEHAEPVFGIKPRVVYGLARSLGCAAVDRLAQRKYFKELTRRADAFPTLSGKVDYLHYQTYIVNGYGQRGHDLVSYYALPFLFLENGFLQKVFGMPRERKEGFAIVTAGIKRWAPALAGIPYTSANEKALGERKRAFFEPIKAFLMGVVAPLMHAVRPPHRKGRGQISPAEQERLQAVVAHSDITRLLKSSLMAGGAPVPYLHMDYALQGLFYLDHCERAVGVTFEMR